MDFNVKLRRLDYGMDSSTYLGLEIRKPLCRVTDIANPEYR